MKRIFGLLALIGFGSNSFGQNSTMSYGELFTNEFKGSANYIWNQITFQTDHWYENYFGLLLVLSLVVWALEIAFPWRKNQGVFRKDFWLDAFYMFFNFFVFALVISGFYKIVNHLYGGNVSDLAVFNVKDWNPLLALFVFFILNDFVQWFTHVLLHRFNFLWRFHKVHHSVEEMGFAAHLRYHWMENILYKPLKTLVIMLIGGFEPEQAFMVHYISIAIGHLNHSNLNLSYGPFKYILNNPKMHIWHHAYELPTGKKYGVNFGISLSAWDYIFRTNYIPYSGRDIRLGFERIEDFPQTFWGQLIYGFRKGKDER